MHAGAQRTCKVETVLQMANILDLKFIHVWARTVSKATPAWPPGTYMYTASEPARFGFGKAFGGGADPGCFTSLPSVK